MLHRRQINAVINLILCFLFLLPSCVREVDFSVSYKKKIVVYCVIHSYGGVYLQNQSGLSPDYSIYSHSSEVQRLYMYYNSPGGEKEFLDDATARLWDDETNELLAEFSRVSEEEWETNYCPSYKKISEQTNRYSIHLRLEIDVPGENNIIARSSLERNINVMAWRPYHSMDTKQLYYRQEDVLSGPVWFLPEAIETLHTLAPPGYHGGGSWKYIQHVPVRAIASDYSFADSFNRIDDVYLYGIRVLPKNQGLSRYYSMEEDDKRPVVQVGERENIQYKTYIHLTYVSEEYDNYLRDAVVYRIRHDNESDPLTHLYEDQIYTNIEGGTGVFGVEVVVFNPETVFNE